MRRFLAALTVLSIVVMAQSVVAITPAPSAQIEGLETMTSSDAAHAAHTAAVGGAPQPMAVFLLLTGLSGLAAAGGRPRPIEDSVDG